MTRRFRRLTVGVNAVLFFVIPLLTPMAYASPPDPSWIHGVYDGGDFDDVVVLVTSGAGIVELSPLGDLSCGLPPVSWSVQSPDNPALTESPDSLHSRAPPAQ